MKLTKESIFNLFLGIICLLPFITINWSYEGYEFPKFLFLVCSSFLLGILFLFSKPQKIVLPNKFLLFYFSTFFLSLIFSSDLLISFFGNYPRFSSNFFLILSILIILIVHQTYFKKIDIFQINFYLAIFLSLLTFLESKDRVYSLLGQPNFLGIVIILGIIYGIKNIKINKIFLIPIFLFLIVLFKTASLTNIFILLFISTYFLFERNTKKSWLIIILFSTIILFVISPITNQKIKDNLNIFIGNETKISDSLYVRFLIWEDSLKIINTKNFVLGNGPDTFSLFFEEVRSNKLNYSSEWDALIDKSHNYFLDILIEQGFASLIFFIILLFKTIKEHKDLRLYLYSIIIFLIFNWSFLYLSIILFMALSYSNNEEIILDKNFRIMIFIILLIGLYIFIKNIFLLEEINKEKIYPKSKNPQVVINNLEIMSKQELPSYINFLNNKYQDNLSMQFSIYKIEKHHNLESRYKTKENIKGLREDLIIWNDILKE